MRKESKDAVYQSGHLNPFLPLNIYIPDVEPKVFGDRVYLYGSKDLFGGEYCCYKYHVYSAHVDNLQEWVAESDYPYGPFTNCRQITMDGEPIKGIDPSVLEHEGEVYYTWGQGNC